MTNRFTLTARAIAAIGALGAAASGPAVGAPATAPATAVGFASAAALQASCAERQAGSISPATGRTLAEAYEKFSAEDLAGAVVALNRLIERGVSGYERAVVLQLRGSAYAQQENYAAARRDFIAALEMNVFPCDTEASLYLNVGQFYLIDQDYSAAIRYLENWLSQTDAPTASGYFLLANAYAQADRWRDAVRPAEQAIDLAETPNRSYYTLLNAIYAQVNESTKRRELLRNGVGFFPSQKDFWVQLSQLYNEAGRERDAFAVLELAYRAGLLDRASEFVALAQYMSVLDNPYRGGKILSREMDAGNVPRTTDNLKLLSQLWSQARENERAIPPLAEAARADGSGKTALRLAQIYVGAEDYPKAESAARDALRKGGMNASDTASARFILGFSLFSQEKLVEAREQFEISARDNTQRGPSNSYIEYIDAVIRQREAQTALEKRQAEEAARREEERLRNLREIEALSGRSISGDDDEDGDDGSDDDGETGGAE